MTVENEKDLAGLKKIGRIIALTLKEMQESVGAGITTAELDDIGSRCLREHGARSAPFLTYGFPGATCISLNNEAAHGVPGNRVILPGDLVNMDVSAELDGYYADASTTVLIPPVDPLKQKLCDCTRSARRKAIAAVRTGRPLNIIGKTIEAEARRCGFHVIRDLPGHGLGRGLHEEPTIPGFYVRSATRRLTDGLVITIEPFLSTGANHIVEGQNGWTLKTPDGSLSAQYEHTIVVTRGHPIVVTAL
jgi:methionyl aminopeptidase